MIKLTLLSLDALIDVPILMTNAFVRAIENKIEPIKVMSLLAQKQFDEKRAAQVLATRTGKDVTSVLLAFYRHLPTGAHKLIFDNAYEVLASGNDSKQGIFYGLPQKALQEIVRNTNFAVDAVYGSRAAMTTLEVALEAASGYPEKDICYVTGGITNAIPEFNVDGYTKSRRLRSSEGDLPVIIDELTRQNDAS